MAPRTTDCRATTISTATDLPTMMPQRGIGVAPSRFRAPYRRSKPTAMAWPVKAVDMIATVRIAGTKRVARSAGPSPKVVLIGSRHNPMRSVIGMNMVSSSCSPLRSRSLSSSVDWAMIIAARDAGRGAGRNMPSGKRSESVAGEFTAGEFTVVGPVR